MIVQRRRATTDRLAIGLILLASVVLAACSSAGSSTAPSAPTAPTATAAASAAGAASTASSASAPAAGGGSTTSQTDTDWGRIWDTLPKGFPTIPGSTPDDAAAGPASAVLVVQGDAAQTVASSLQTQLQAAGYTTTALGGPLEDGTYTLDMTGPSTGCMLQVAATPTGGLTTVTILYGAACQHD